MCGGSIPKILMNMFDVHIINLNRHKDRWYFMMGFLQSLGFPLEHGIVKRVTAHDGRDYSSPDQVIDAAGADGFDYLADPSLLYDQIPPSKFKIASNWSYASALRGVANSDKIVMLLIDDYQPNPRWTYERFSNLLVTIQAKDPGFRLLQLRAQPFAYLSEMEFLDDDFLVASLLRKGIGGGGDMGLLMNNKGAQLVLDYHQRVGIPSFTFSRMARSRRDFQGCWHTGESLISRYYKFESSREEE